MARRRTDPESEEQAKGGRTWRTYTAIAAVCAVVVAAVGGAASLFKDIDTLLTGRNKIAEWLAPAAQELAIREGRIVVIGNRDRVASVLPDQSEFLQRQHGKVAVVIEAVLDKKGGRPINKCSGEILYQSNVFATSLPQRFKSSDGQTMGPYDFPPGSHQKRVLFFFDIGLRLGLASRDTALKDTMKFSVSCDGIVSREHEYTYLFPPGLS